MATLIPEDATATEVVKSFNVSRESFEKLQIYADLLKKWQLKINLVGPREVPRIWSRHIADALQLVEHIPSSISCAVDLGAGAGIPGLIVAAALQERGFHIHLVESNGKKAAFLRTVLRELDVSGEVHCERIESLQNKKWVDDVQLVLARALAPLPKLLNLSLPFVEKNGKMLFLKGLDVDSELTQSTKYWNIRYEKYPSRTNAGGYILDIKEFRRVAGSQQS